MCLSFHRHIPGWIRLDLLKTALSDLMHLTETSCDRVSPYWSLVRAIGVSDEDKPEGPLKGTQAYIKIRFMAILTMLRFVQQNTV